VRLRFGPIGRALRASLLAGLLLAAFGSGVRAADPRSSIGGTVYLDKNRDGQPSGKPGLEGVEVRLDGQGRSDRARSGPKGGYGFDDLKAGSYDVTVIPPPGYETSTEPLLVVTVDGRNSTRVLNFGLSPLRPTATPTATTTPTATAVPRTATPTATRTPSPAEATPTATGTAVGGGRGGPGLPNIASLSPLRYAPGRDRASQIGGWTSGNTIALGVPFRSQLDGSDFAKVNCGPASLAMALAAFGIDLHPDTIRDYVNFLTQNADPDSGTSLDALARIAREAGLASLDLYGRGSYRTWTVDLVRDHIRQGHPVITLARYQSLPGNASSRAEADHYIVVTGLAGDDFIYNDAAFIGRAGYALMISAEDLERAWQFSSIPGNGMALTLEGEPTIPAWLAARRGPGPPTAPEVHGESRADGPVQADAAAPIEEPTEPAATPTEVATKRKRAPSTRRTAAAKPASTPVEDAAGRAAEPVEAASPVGPFQAAALALLLGLGGSGLAGRRWTKLLPGTLAALRRRRDR
jgi:hypothetical protein